MRESTITSTTNDRRDDVTLGEELTQRVACCIAVDRAVRTYERKRAGLEAWTNFVELLPRSLREPA